MKKINLQYCKYKMPQCLFTIILFFCTTIFSSQATYSKAFSKQIVQTESEQVSKGIKADKKTVGYKSLSYNKIAYVFYNCYNKILVLVIQNSIEKAICLQHLTCNFSIRLIKKFSPILSFPKEDSNPSFSSIKG
jgi:hypothetical protein